MHETHICRDCGAEITIPYSRPEPTLEFNGRQYEVPVFDEPAPRLDQQPSVGLTALRVALRTEMGWSDHEVEDFLTEHRLVQHPDAEGEPEHPVSFIDCETHPTKKAHDLFVKRRAAVQPKGGPECLHGNNAMTCQQCAVLNRRGPE